jgi:hypothetical protein
MGGGAIRFPLPTEEKFFSSSKPSPFIIENIIKSIDWCDSAKSPDSRISAVKTRAGSRMAVEFGQGVDCAINALDKFCH